MWKYRGQKRPHFADKPAPDKESVWDYPRPPKIESDKRLVQVRYQDQIIVETSGAYRILETASPPTFYLPPEDVFWALLSQSPAGSVCEWKGTAQYWQLSGKPDLGAVGWSYANPNPSFTKIRNHISFYPALLECFVSGERVRPQPGQFYGGWVTDDIVGPFKGEPGSEFW